MIRLYVAFAIFSDGYISANNVNFALANDLRRSLTVRLVEHSYRIKNS